MLMEKKRYFKNNEQYFNFVRKHPELRIISVSFTKTSIVVTVTKTLGRPRKVDKNRVKNGQKVGV